MRGAADSSGGFKAQPRGLAVSKGVKTDKRSLRIDAYSASTSMPYWQGRFAEGPMHANALSIVRRAAAWLGASEQCMSRRLQGCEVGVTAGVNVLHPHEE